MLEVAMILSRCYKTFLEAETDLVQFAKQFYLIFTKFIVKRGLQYRW